LLVDIRNFFYWRVLLRLRTFVNAFKRSSIHHFALFFRFLRHAASPLFLEPCNDCVSTFLHGRVRAEPTNPAESAHFFRLRSSFPWISFLPTWIFLSPQFRIVGSRLLSHSREFLFSCIGEIRRIDGNLISRERTDGIERFRPRTPTYMCTPKHVCDGKMFLSRADYEGRRLEGSAIKRSRVSFFFLYETR